MKDRINIYQLQPDAYKGMFELEIFLEKSKLNKQQISLIKMRASQINGCAYCIKMHMDEAIKAGDSHERLHLLNAWEDNNLFTGAEKAMLALTEEITLINKNGVSDKIYENARIYFDEDTIVAIIMAATTINAWNRIAISTKLKPN